MTTIKPKPDSFQIPHTRSEVSTIQYSGVLGNIGASLRDESDDFEDFEPSTNDGGFETRQLLQPGETEDSRTSFSNMRPDVAEMHVAGPSRHPYIRV